MTARNIFKILHTEAAPGWGGQEIRILQESTWLAGKGHRIFILCRPDSEIHARYSRKTIPNLSIHAIPFQRTLDPGDIFTIFKFIRKERVDIVHTHSSIDSWTASIAAKLAGVPIVRSRHVSIPIKDFFPRNLVYRFPDRIIASGKRIAEMVSGLKTVSKDNVVSIPAGINPERFRPGIDGSSFREESGIPKGAFLIGKVAVIRGWKGHMDFIAAAEIVLRRAPDAVFAIVGDGPGFERVKNAIRSKGLEKSIIMTGYREDIPAVMNALDILVLASTSGEATSQVIPQAWACKRCVLATEAGGITDIVRHGENGFLVPPGDPDRMADGLLQLMESGELRNRLAEAGHSFALKHLTEGEMMDRTLSVYRELSRE